MNTPANVTDEHPNPEWRHLEVVRHPDGIVAVLTERIKDGSVSFSIVREYEVNGQTKRTAYLRRHHLPAVQQLLSDLSERLELAEDRTRTKRR